MRQQRLFSLLCSCMMAFLLSACGGGGASSPVSTSSSAVTNAVTEPGAPTLTGNTAIDGFNWFNFRRVQLGLGALEHNSLLDVAAQAHSEYQKSNDTITHVEIVGKPGFTGVNLIDRLRAAGYGFSATNYAYGEVISSTGDRSGVNAAEDLITAIYHRFVIFEPRFKQAGVGAASVNQGYTYFTCNLVADNLNVGLGAGKIVVYPSDGQKNVLTLFNSNYESPDPVPDRDIVGFPLSVHADLGSQVKVQSFTLSLRGGLPLTSLLLSSATDAQTPTSAAALIPLAPLLAGSSYDARFIGTINGISIDKSWTFTTR